MTSKKNTNKALFSSVIALILCCSMLVGSTFAWFTDEVNSDVNKIVAGNLDVDVLVDDTSIEGIKTLFNDVALWEPGAVAYENLTVVNKGNLALKYELAINFKANGVNSKGETLAKALQVGVVSGGIKTGASREEAVAAVQTWQPLESFIESGELLENGKTDVYGIVIYWQPSENDNDFNMNNGNQGKTLSIELGVNLHAWQKDHEEDSIDETYDAVVHTEAQLLAALEEGINNPDINVVLANNIQLTGTWTPVGNEDEDKYFTGTLDGKGYTISGLNVVANDYDALIRAAKNATIKNLTVEGTVNGVNAAGIVARVEGNTVIENCVSKVTVTGTTKAGGIVCNVTNSGKTVISNCVNNGDVNGGDNGIGGLVGYVNNDAYLEIFNCTNNGDVTSDNNEYSGAAVGYAAANSTGMLINMTNTGMITGTVLPPASGVDRYLEVDGSVALGYCKATNWTSASGVDSATELADALANGGNVILFNDVTLGENDSIVIPAGVTATLDLNGHTVRQEKVQTGAYALIDNKGTLTISDSVGTGKVSYADVTTYTKDPGWASNTIRNTGVLNITGGTIENVTSEEVKDYGYPHAIDVYQGSTTNITGGTIKSANYDAIRMFCNSETLATTVNISGGTIVNRISFQDPSSTKAGYGRLNISGGTFITTDGVTANVRLLNFSKNSSNMKAVVTGGTFDKGFFTQDVVNAGVKMSDWLSYNDSDLVIPGTTITLNKADRNQDGGIIHLNNENDIWYLNTLISEWTTLTGTVGHDHYYYRSAWQVVLHCDVDLGNKAWTPVNLGKLSGFDGQNHTISNLNVTGTDSVGLFSSTLNNDSGRCYVSNLVIDGATVTGTTKVGVVVGYSPAPITNVTVKNATVAAEKYAGIIAGKAGSSFVDCSVIDSTITATDKEIGGLVGFLDVADGNPGATYTVEIKGCKIQNVTVKGTEEVGGLIGRAYARESTTIAISGNSVNATVIATLGTYTDNILGRNYGGNITIA